MNRQVLGKCPVCDNELNVTRLTCHNCNTSIDGDFTLCKFCNLSNEEKHFIEIFIKSRGNIKEIEKELDMSYRTVRGKLEDVIKALGYNSKEDKNSIDKKSILEQLNNGEITSKQALELLKGDD